MKTGSLLSALLLTSVTAAQLQLPFQSRNDQFSAATDGRPALAGNRLERRGDRVLRYSFRTREEVLQAIGLLSGLNNVDVWHQTKSTLDLRFPLEYEPTINSLIRQEPTILIDSITSLLESTPSASAPYNLLHSQAALANLSSSASPASAFSRSSSLRDRFLNDHPIHQSYHPYDAIVEILRGFEREFPRHAQVISFGNSSEGREILGLRITKDNGKEPPLPPPEEDEPGEGDGDDDDDDDEGDDDDDDELETLKKDKHKKKHKGKKDKKKEKEPSGQLEFLVVGGQHAREWIAPATVLYIAHKILLSTPYIPPNRTATTTHSKDPIYTMLKTMTFTFLPVVNVDGYAFSWDHDRLWRKNRQVVTSSKEDSECYGIDLNRNWGYKWEGGSRPNPCSDSFAGSEPFQAPELKALRNYISDSKNRIVAFLDLHAFGEMIMYPFSWSCSKASPDEENHAEAAFGAQQALRSVNGRVFEVGSICAVALTGPGESVDWTYSVANVRWSFAIELRDYIWGFLLPSRMIVPSSEELSAAMFSIAGFVQAKEGGKKRFDVDRHQFPDLT